MALINEENNINQKISELAALMERVTGEDGFHSTVISGLQVIRNSNITAPIHQVHQPALCVIAQGSKEVMLGQESYRYDPTDYLVISVDLPISGQIIEATPDAPYLCLILDLDTSQVLDMINDSDPRPNKTYESNRGLFLSKTNAPLLDAVVRLTRLLETPKDIPILAPMVIREILYRVLDGPQGDSVKQIAMSGSSANRIANVIKRIKKDYDKPLRIEELAAFANMSSASLHRHFKEVTAMSPLQFQKLIRLQEARRLLLSESADAAEVGFRVGYESPSHFSREYSRLFGMPPISDIKRLRHPIQQ